MTGASVRAARRPGRPPSVRSSLGGSGRGSSGRGAPPVGSVRGSSVAAPRRTRAGRSATSSTTRAIRSTSLRIGDHPGVDVPSDDSPDYGTYMLYLVFFFKGILLLLDSVLILCGFFVSIESK